MEREREREISRWPKRIFIPKEKRRINWKQITSYIKSEKKRQPWWLGDTNSLGKGES